MLKKFLPSQDDFFVLFDNMAVSLTGAALALHQLLQQNSNQITLSEQILNFKNDSEIHARGLFMLMHKRFITPFDRYDIHRLNDKLYDIVNTINLTTQRFCRYQLTEVPSVMLKLAQTSYRSALLVQQALGHLHDIKNNQDLTITCAQIKSYESDADHMLIDGVNELLEMNIDFKTFFKCKEIYDLLESVTDRCQEVAFIVEGILLEYA